jgi:hypothetical protein
VLGWFHQRSWSKTAKKLNIMQVAPVPDITKANPIRLTPAQSDRARDEGKEATAHLLRLTARMRRRDSGSSTLIAADISRR